MENDQNLFTEYALKAGEFIAKDLEKFGDQLVTQNLTEYQKIEATIVRLTDQIERNQVLAQAYLQRAVTEIGQDSKAAKLLTDTAVQQTQVVTWLKGLSQDAIQTASALETNLIDAKTLKIVGEAGGATLDALQIVVKLAQGDNVGVVNDAVGIVAGMLLSAVVVAMIPAEASAGIIAGAVALASVIGSEIGSRLDWAEGIIDFVSRNLINPLDGLSNLGKFIIGDAAATQFTSATAATQPVYYDPLALDLDNDGIETVGINGYSSVLFDHNADGLKAATGWVTADDGLLAIDRNGNGSIDNGRELFGIDYLKQSGQLANDGFDALRDLDSNADNVFDANDSEFANVRVWLDLNQDGVSQANELFTLEQLNIQSIALNASQQTVNLGNGNQQTDSAVFTRTDGSTGTAGNLDFSQNNFYRSFADAIDTTGVDALPDMHGAGAVRDLREAAALSPTLAQLLTNFAAADLVGQQGLLDQILKAWSDNSPMDATFTGAYAAGHALTVNIQNITTGSAAYNAWADKLTILEHFNGRTFNAVPGGKAANNETWKIAA